MFPVRKHLYYDFQDQIYCAEHATLGEIGICVSHVLKHFLRSTPSTTGAHNGGGQSLSFPASLRADDLISPVPDFRYFLTDLERTASQFEITGRTGGGSSVHGVWLLVPMITQQLTGPQILHSWL